MTHDRDVALLLCAVAAVIDTAVLWGLCDRRNFPRVMRSLWGMVAGVWLYQAGSLVHEVLASTAAAWAEGPDRLAMTLMCAGLALQPSTALHTAWRLHLHGFAPRPPVRPTVAVLYAPLLLLPWVAAYVHRAPYGPFLDMVAPWVPGFLTWLGLANGVAAGWALWLRRRHRDRAERHFLAVLAAALTVLIVAEAVAVLVLLPEWPAGREVLLIAATVAPVCVSLLVAYVILRFGFMQLVLRRSVLYAVGLLVIVLLHRLVLQDIWDNLSEHYHLDFALLEGLLIIAVVLVYRPLRERASEALHYLMGERLGDMRQQARKLSRQMATLFCESPAQVVDWFAAETERLLGVGYVAVWLLDSEGRVRLAGGRQTERLEDEEVLALFNALQAAELVVCQRNDAPDRHVHDMLRRTACSLAAIVRHPQVSGLILFGERQRHRDLVGEQLSTVSLWVEQLGITLNNAHLQAERLAAERRALQNDKLATLGLLVSAIAHEVKNPLSSIKTLATVMAEDFADEPEPTRELQLILGEVDRLSLTVGDILSFARPAQAPSSGPPRAAVAEAVTGVLQIMRHVARQHGVHTELHVDEALPAVAMDENGLREVLFNLLGNAIEAAGVGGTVTLRAAMQGGQVVLDVTDTGPGIPQSIRERLFEPFVTTRAEGTGLGLYVASRRVRDAGGDIAYQDARDGGTCFSARLPVAATSSSSGADG